MDKENKVQFILNCGKYVGGKDIPIGVYDLLIISGTGNIETKNLTKYMKGLVVIC